MTLSLESCPHCAAPQPVVEMKHRARERGTGALYWVECGCCHARSGEWDRDDKAQYYWNMRRDIVNTAELHECGFFEIVDLLTKQQS